MFPLHPLKAFVLRHRGYLNGPPDARRADCKSRKRNLYLDEKLGKSYGVLYRHSGERKWQLIVLSKRLKRLGHAILVQSQLLQRRWRA